MSKRRNKNFLIWFLFILTVVLIAFSIFITRNKPIESEEFDVFFIVRDSGIGFNVDDSVLNFGILNPGGMATRNITVENSKPYPVEVIVLVSENLNGLINSGPSYFIQPREKLNLDLTLSLSQNFSFGNYSGKIRFDIYKAD